LIFPQQLKFRLLLDQSFPKPPGFAVTKLDASVEAIHLFEFDRTLSERSTPDWMLYCLAAEKRFDAFVTRDQSQIGQLVEMYALSRLGRFSVITWRKPIDDPIREWGQLLAYLPEIKKRLGSGPSKVIILPNPTITSDNLHDPKATLATEARKLGISVNQARQEALREMRDWLELTGQDEHRFDRLLRIRSAKRPSE
jgi:hypothetical protein